MLKIYKFYIITIGLLAGLSLHSCSLPYYTSAGYHQARLLLSRKSIDSALKEEKLDLDLKNKLELTLIAREYADKIGLKPGKTFLTFATKSDIPKSWLVIAAKSLKLEVYEWKFPIVGSLPYKGFFSPEEAETEKIKLEKEGYDTTIRTSAAYSTLGWFDDPIMPSTLSLDHLALFNTVVHEIVHTSFWIKGQVAFNETMANAVGFLATATYFKSKETLPELINNISSDFNPIIAIKNLVRECELSKEFSKTKIKLDETFNTDISDEEKLAIKNKVYIELENKILELYDHKKTKSDGNINNASFLAQYTYLQDFELFLLLFKEKGSISEMIKALESISKEPETETSPFNVLRSRIENTEDEINCKTLIMHDNAIEHDL
ncbi:MAG TPA: aminopeptidase [Oligoflexia bacterium]|nr:aminopeptidase [Oligoflexia bacterium]HMP48246.1 aminopeptidase [Oligoflexia bacterium]